MSMDTDSRRYGIWVDDELAGYADYVDDHGVRLFTDTVIYPEFGTRGLATKLIRVALDETRQEGLRVVAQCAFVARFIQQRPAYRDLLVAQRVAA